ncbi:MAG TPA: DUF58 domain-containing protein [Fimbriimonas sp.]|nr:DUF58 domain-containing protein [Fimbriimonas sp.]
MRYLAGFALTWASVFLALVAMLIGSPALFYITTALIATIGACHLQAYLAVRGLRVERVAPQSLRVGDLVTIELTVWSTLRIKRTLITVWDNLPRDLALSHRSPSLPIAPAFDQPIRTRYQLRALKRGHFTWSDVLVTGTDALGLITKTRHYETATAEMVVLPRPIPLSVELPTAAGWGVNESESGQTRGAGIEPRGIRQYRFGDSLRHIHWQSTARTGQLLVKEFEAGTQAAAGFCIQHGNGTEIGVGAATTLEQMCGNVAFLAETFLRQGARVFLPGLETRASHFAPHERVGEVYHTLAEISTDSPAPLADDVITATDEMPFGSVLYVLVAVAEEGLAPAIARACRSGLKVVALVYDAYAFQKTKAKQSFQSAVNPDFTTELRSVGATLVLVPIDVVMTEDGVK